MKIIAGFIVIIIGMWLGVRFLEPKLIYYPSRQINLSSFSFLANFEEVTFKTEDGETLWGWLLINGNNSGTIIYFHGNAGNITDRTDIIYNLYTLGYNVFAFDYRGYGKSSGTPDEDGLFKDGKASLEYIRERFNTDSPVIFFGESLGSAVAIHLAQEKNSCNALIITGVFTSIKEMSKEVFPIIPLYIFTRSRYNSINKIKNVNVPVLVIHGTNDKVIPFSHGEKIYQEANNPKKFMPVYGAGHNDIYAWENGFIYEIMGDFLKQNDL